MTAADGVSALPGIPAAAGSCLRLAVCYDGCWYQNAARFFTRVRGAELSVAGLHDTFRWHAAGVFGCPPGRVAVTQAHYVAGRDPDAGPGQWDRVLADHGIVRHDVPVTGGKGEVGADVEFALTCYQIACDTSVDMIVLVAGDGDFAPLAARLAGRGLRVLVPRANFSYPAGESGTVTVTTSALLTRRATDTPALTDLIDAAMGPDYPPHLARPLTQAAPPAAASPAGQASRHRGTVARWSPGARYGFITSSGRTWYASAKETPGHHPLAPGTPVTFTGRPDPPPGKLYPPASAILPEPPGTEILPETAAPAAHPRGSGRSAHWLTAIDSQALSRLRHQSGWTKGELARQSGVSVTTINRLEQADLTCHIRTLSRVAAALGTPPATITSSHATRRTTQEKTP